MAAPSPLFEVQKEKALFWKLGRIIATAVASIAAVAGLITNLQGISGFLQPSLTGKWRLETKTEQTSYAAYKGKSTAFWLFLNDDGHNLTGNAEKFQFDDKDLPVPQHQQLKLTGQISGGDVILDYDEKAGSDGAARETSGEFKLKVIRTGILRRRAARMEGTFSGTAANSSGSAFAVLAE